mgnify:FL=1
MIQISRAAWAPPPRPSRLQVAVDLGKKDNNNHEKDLIYLHLGLLTDLQIGRIFLR